ncbi:hypothetical protein O77CONTIG1_01198 [Leptolyngbya sp. O-77]|nr:hypothetical protein O77CONTIG1_01198 [Leptolyngbya sp. O-77]
MTYPNFHGVGFSLRKNSEGRTVYFCVSHADNFPYIQRVLAGSEAVMGSLLRFMPDAVGEYIY